MSQYKSKPGPDHRKNRFYSDAAGCDVDLSAQRTAAFELKRWRREQRRADFQQAFHAGSKERQNDHS